MPPRVLGAQASQHPLVSLSTTRELCAVAGAQNVVRDHIALFGMLLYVYSEGV